MASWRPETGSSLGERFHLSQVMAVTPTGVVYQAEGPDGPVVVKCLHPGLFTGSYGDINLERVQRGAGFRHPAMVMIHELALDGPVPYLVMERVQGSSLVTWMADKGPLPIEQVFQMMEGLVEPLHAVQVAGSHGNLRPSNIFIEAGGDVRLSSPWYLEGLAELPEDDLPSREMAWLAPEQTRGRWEERGETDVYGFALLMGYLLAGTPVMGGRSLIQQRVIVPEVVDEVFKRATQVRPEERYGAILDVWAAVDLAWRTTQETHETDDDLAGTTTGLSAGLGWSPAAVEETQQVPPPSSLAALRESQESDAEAYESLEAQLTESQQEEARLEMQDRLRGAASPEDDAEPTEVSDGDPPAHVSEETGEIVRRTPVEQAPDMDGESFGVGALEEDSSGVEDDEPSGGGRETSVIPRDSHVVGGEMSDTSSVQAIDEDALEGDGPQLTPDGSVTSTLNVRVGTTVAQPSGGAEQEQEEELPSVQLDVAALVPPTLPGDADAEAIPVVSLDAEPPGEELERTIRQVPGPGTARALEAAIQAQAKRSQDEGEEETRAGAALEATLQGGRSQGGGFFGLLPGNPRRVPITVLAPLMLCIALLFSFVLLVDLQKEPDLTGSITDDPEAEMASGVVDSPAKESPSTGSPGEGTSAQSGEAAVPLQEGSGTPTSVVSPSTPCPADMVLLSRKNRDGRATGTMDWCIERYEYPGKGEVPRTGVTLAAAAMLCEARGGRRLCTQEEWREGCGGRYPYGRKYDPDACGTLARDQKPRGVAASGTYARCTSSWGIYDLVGNVAEWTAGGLIQGGSAALDGERATCNYAVPGREARADVGFRCCQMAVTPQGEP